MTLGAIITEIERTVKKETYSVSSIGGVQEKGRLLGTVRPCRMHLDFDRVNAH